MAMQLLSKENIYTTVLMGLVLFNDDALLMYFYVAAVILFFELKNIGILELTKWEVM